MKIFASFCIWFAFFLFIGPQLSGFGEFRDANDHQIAFKAIKFEELTAEELKARKKIFVKTFVHVYSDFEPQWLKPHFTTHDDTRRWLKKAFNGEKAEVQDAGYPIRWIDILKDETIIGFAVFEQNAKDPRAWHIRQMAILPDEQRHGYGRKLVDSIKEIENVTKTTADTRILNLNARAAYKRYGFHELETPHDTGLSTDYYLGLEQLEE